MNRSNQQRAAIRRKQVEESMGNQPELKNVESNMRRVLSAGHLFAEDLVCRKHGCEADWETHQLEPMPCEGQFKKPGVLADVDLSDLELSQIRVDMAHVRGGDVG